HRRPRRNRGIARLPGALGSARRRRERLAARPPQAGPARFLMLRTYRAAFRAPGAFAFSAACFVMRSSIAVYPVGLVLLVSLRTGHYTFAGVLSGIYVSANGIGNPVLARVIVRRGQGPVLLPATAVHVGAVAAIIALAQAHAPEWSLVPPT